MDSPMPSAMKANKYEPGMKRGKVLVETKRFRRALARRFFRQKRQGYQPKRRLGSQPTRSAEERSFSKARFWIWRTRSLLMRSR